MQIIHIPFVAGVFIVCSCLLFQGDITRIGGALEALNGRARYFLPRFEGKHFENADARAEVERLSFW